MLRNSHILPQWSFRRVIRTGGDPNPVFVVEDEARRGGKQFTEPLLCTPCEQRFGISERYVAEIALQPNETFPAFEGTRLIADLSDTELTVVDISALSLLVRFGASVIWRASISRTFDRVRLGDRYDEQLRQFLAGDDPHLPPAFRTTLEFVRPAPNVRVDEVVVAPHSTKFDGYHEHQFSVFGFTFHLLVGGLTPAVYDHRCAQRTSRAIVSDGSSILRGLARMFERVLAKGGPRSPPRR